MMFFVSLAIYFSYFVVVLLGGWLVGWLVWFLASIFYFWLFGVLLWFVMVFSLV